MERLVEEAYSLFTVSLPAIDDAEVGDDLCLVLLVAELPKDDARLFQMLDRLGLGTALGERKGEAVERQRFGLVVAEVARDLESDPMLFGRLAGCTSSSKLCSELVELERLTPAACVNALCRLGSEAVDGDRVGPERACEEGVGAGGEAGRRPPRSRSKTPHPLLDAEIPDSALDPELPESLSHPPFGVCR